VPIAAFVKKEIQENIKHIDIKAAVEIMTMMLREGYKQYALHDDDEAYIQEKMAKEMYDSYQADWSFAKARKTDLPESFEMLRYIALTNFLNDEMFPPTLRLSLLGRMKLERPQLYRQLEGIAKKLKSRAESDETGKSNQ
jgi:hypothetical protein